jgi:pimeloyl-ACP methyl ester carboxylesterase
MIEAPSPGGFAIMRIGSAALAVVIALGVSAAGHAADAPPPMPAAMAGHWEGELVEQGQALPIRFDFLAEAGAPWGRFSADRWQVMDYPLGGLKLDGVNVAFGMGGMELDGVVKGDAVVGTFKGDDGAGAFVLHRTAPAPPPYRVTEVSFPDGGVTLSATLVTPQTPGHYPAVVLAHGSGPESRWGANRYVADRLARAGVAALIYDKRGSGLSTGDWRSATYTDLAHDLVAGVDFLASRDDIDPARIGVLGHSEGGIVAPIAATLAPDRIAFVIAEDAPAMRIKDQDVYRVERDIASQPWSDADKQQALATYRVFVDVAAGDRPFAEYETLWTKYQNAAWFQYLGLPPKGHWIWTEYPKRAHLDTSTLWTGVKRPVLLIYGEEDPLMPVDATIRRLEDVLDGSGAPYTALIAPRAQHNLTIHPGPGERFFWWRQAPGLHDTVAAWILRCTAPDGPCRTR